MSEGLSKAEGEDDDEGRGEERKGGEGEGRRPDHAVMHSLFHSRKRKGFLTPRICERDKKSTEKPSKVISDPMYSTVYIHVVEVQYTDGVGLRGDHEANELDCKSHEH